MTTLDERGRPGRAAMWLAHYNPLFLVAFAGLSIVYDAYHAVWVAWVSTVFFAVWSTSMILHLRYHYGRLCERCVRESPLDPRAAVGRWMPAL